MVSYRAAVLKITIKEKILYCLFYEATWTDVFLSGELGLFFFLLHYGLHPVVNIQKLLYITGTVPFVVFLPVVNVSGDQIRYPYCHKSVQKAGYFSSYGWQVWFIGVLKHIRDWKLNIWVWCLYCAFSRKI